MPNISQTANITVKAVDDRTRTRVLPEVGEDRAIKAPKRGRISVYSANRKE
jgi:hypothetical protein